ncbi:unnamed protein product [Amoebophrya sp. A120]|nr:unnamed protein product [Amoebophrya sp. A120]|eukprot:GSA120T00010462001.1
MASDSAVLLRRVEVHRVFAPNSSQITSTPDSSSQLDESSSHAGHCVLPCTARSRASYGDDLQHQHAFAPPSKEFLLFLTASTPTNLFVKCYDHALPLPKQPTATFALPPLAEIGLWAEYFDMLLPQLDPVATIRLDENVRSAASSRRNNLASPAAARAPSSNSVSVAVLVQWCPGCRFYKDYQQQRAMMNSSTRREQNEQNLRSGVGGAAAAILSAPAQLLSSSSSSGGTRGKARRRPSATLKNKSELRTVFHLHVPIEQIAGSTPGGGPEVSLNVEKLTPSWCGVVLEEGDCVCVLEDGGATVPGATRRQEQMQMLVANTKFRHYLVYHRGSSSGRPLCRPALAARRKFNRCRARRTAQA